MVFNGFLNFLPYAHGCTSCHKQCAGVFSKHDAGCKGSLLFHLLAQTVLCQKTVTIVANDSKEIRSPTKERHSSIQKSPSSSNNSESVFLENVITVQVRIPDSNDLPKRCIQSWLSMSDKEFFCKIELFTTSACGGTCICLSVSCVRLVFGSFGGSLHWQSLLNKVGGRDFSCCFKIKSVVIGCCR